MGKGIIKYLAESVLSVIYCGNESCIICSNINDNEYHICNVCLSKIVFLNDGFVTKKSGFEIQCFSAAYYTKVITELVRRLKYRSDFNCGETLGYFLVNVINIKSLEFDLITFVPMSKKSLKVRGFNQGEFLAKYIGKQTNKPVVECILKTKDTKDQIGLSTERRWENLADCFKLKNVKAIKNKKVLLVDDVITTGATTFFCAQELLKSEVEKVTVLTAAKSRI